MSQNNKFLIIFGSLFGLSGLGILLGSFISFTSTQDFLRNSASSNGIVIDNKLQYSDDDDGGSTYFPVIRFQTQQGEQVEFQSNFGTNPPSYQVGQEVSVVYNPENAEDAQINSFWSLWFASILLLGMGATFSSVGFGLIFSLLKAKKKMSMLLANGQKILTQFESVQLNYSVSFNDRHPYQIISQWFDPVNQELYVFRSENIWFNPENFIASQEISVYVDPQNLKNYYMDISFLPKLARQ